MMIKIIVNKSDAIMIFANNLFLFSVAITNNYPPSAYKIVASVMHDVMRGYKLFTSYCDAKGWLVPKTSAKPTVTRICNKTSDKYVFLIFSTLRLQTGQILRK